MFNVNGPATSLVWSAAGARTLAAATGVFTLSGKAAGLAFGHNMPTTKGTFTLSGITNILARGRVVPIVKGTFTLTGPATGARAARVTVADKGTFLLNGQAAGLARQRAAVPLATGVFTLSGKITNLIYSGSGPKILPAATGVFTLSGKDATALAVRKMPTTKGTFLLTGQATAREPRWTPRG